MSNAVGIRTEASRCLEGMSPQWAPEIFFCFFGFQNGEIWCILGRSLQSSSVFENTYFTFFFSDFKKHLLFTFFWK